MITKLIEKIKLWWRLRCLEAAIDDTIRHFNGWVMDVMRAGPDDAAVAITQTKWKLAHHKAPPELVPFTNELIRRVELLENINNKRRNK